MSKKLVLGRVEFENAQMYLVPIPSTKRVTIVLSHRGTLKEIALRNPTADDLVALLQRWVGSTIAGVRVE